MRRLPRPHWRRCTASPAPRRTCSRRCARPSAPAARSARSATCSARSGARTTRSAEMLEPRAHLQVLDHLAGLSWKAAKDFEIPTIDHLLLFVAVLKGYPASAAGRALNDCGFTEEALVAALRRRYASARTSPEGPQYTPATMRVLALAEGMASGLGAQ